MIYPFKCSMCNTVAEIICTVNEYEKINEVLCPNCDTIMHRVYDAPHVIFKGHFPGKAIKWEKENKHIQDLKAKVKKARANENIPASETFNIKQAESL